ncbi:DUF1798 family protein [Pontibacillus sp. HMF3514]|uniref:DUF1798 family protein n=1 Tax=Pontibacillus sp. HMF3514 TaxID=2692425 RepID=UPI00131F5D1D|nr:DUF1798 family protein [Pontibacillus sp. HMF3514]QHE54291.1 DUF1798 family protein [Pontibacillus sp. HMF3514]
MKSLEETIMEVKKNLDQLKDLFLQSEKPPDRKDRELFEKVKKESKPLFELNEKWADLAEQYTYKVENSVVYPLQIKNTKENFELVILHSYYIDVPKKRYMELYNSIHYVLDQLLDSIEMNKEADS